MLDANGVRPVGDDADALDIANDKQGRVLERHRVLLKLNKRLVEVLVLSLVFPRKAVLFPDVGPAFAARGFGGSLFEGVPLTVWVHIVRLWLTEKLAEVVEMRVSARPLAGRGGFPLHNKALWRHGYKNTSNWLARPEWLLDRGRVALPPVARR